MKAILSPLPSVVLALVLSVGGAYFWFQGQAARVIAAVVAHRAASIEAARPEAPWDFWTPEMEQVAKELAEHREALVRREAEIQLREIRLGKERQELDEARRQIESLRGEIDARIVQIDAQEQKNLKSLVTTYSKLSPAAAVAIFKQLDDTLVTKLLSLMKPEVATAILEEFSREPGPDEANVKRAAELTQRMRLLMPAPEAKASAR